MRRVLGAFGALLVTFFAGALCVALVGAMDARSMAGRLLIWHGAGTEYVVMSCAIKITLGVWVLLASRDPVEYRHVVDLVLCVHLAHMASMLAMAALDSDHHVHLLGDVPLGLVPGLVVLTLWLPVRQQLGPRVGAAASGAVG